MSMATIIIFYYFENYYSDSLKHRTLLFSLTYAANFRSASFDCKSYFSQTKETYNDIDSLQMC